MVVETPTLNQVSRVVLAVVEAVVTVDGHKVLVLRAQAILVEPKILILPQMDGETMVVMDLTRTMVLVAAEVVELLLMAITEDLVRVVLAALD